ncbi:MULTISPECIES: hypothetical protein [Streptomyces]|uniref:hypothetical protein n=1 Tax=Streptomyces TaxID=1883 RepID=UPI000BCA46E4|nr:hypothetical protein [Streptomyces sp. 1222.2]SOD75996.1 hypothetical protein SAMN06272781_3818 [Streptomyces sp. 1222.2]
MSSSDASAKLAAILLEFSDMVGSRPSLEEFLQLLEWSSGGIYSPPLTFEATLADGTVYTGPGGSRVPELSDSIFTDMADILAGLLDEGSENPMSTSDLVGILLPFVNDEAASLMDVSSGDVSQLSIAGGSSIAEPKVGDILAIPVDNAWYAVIVVARNRFGVALGIFRDKFHSQESVYPRRSAVRTFPVYSDDVQVLNGSWKVIGHDESFLSMFPVEPEIYHSPIPAWPGREVGEFGAAETPAGDIRLIDGDEARTVGIVDGSYRQSYSSELLQQSLGGLVSR